MAWTLAAAMACAAVPDSGRAQQPRPAQGQAGEREVTVVNRSPRRIQEIYVSPATSDQWGADRLGDRALNAGAALRLRLGRIRDCAFDVKVIYEDATQEESRGLNLCRDRRVTFNASTAIPVPESGAEHEVVLVNRSARPIQQVYLSSAEASEWGDDRIPEASISVGDQRAIAWRGPCKVDLRVVFDNRGAEERREVNLCAVPILSIEPGWTTADVLPSARAAAGVLVANRSGLPVIEFYLVPEGTAQPGRDLLGATILPPGGETRLRVAGEGCRYSARVVFNGKVPDTRIDGLDLCDAPRIEIAPP